MYKVVASLLLTKLASAVILSYETDIKFFMPQISANITGMEGMSSYPFLVETDFDNTYVWSTNCTNIIDSDTPTTCDVQPTDLDTAYVVNSSLTYDNFDEVKAGGYEFSGQNTSAVITLIEAAPAVQVVYFTDNVFVGEIIEEDEWLYNLLAFEKIAYGGLSLSWGSYFMYFHRYENITQWSMETGQVTNQGWAGASFNSSSVPKLSIGYGTYDFNANGHSQVSLLLGDDTSDSSNSFELELKKISFGNMSFSTDGSPNEGYYKEIDDDVDAIFAWNF